MKTGLLCACIVAVVATSSGQELPLPSALMTAKTAHVVNLGVNQNVFERLILELQAWKRFTLVEDPAQADITITLGGTPTVATNGATGQTFGTTEYRVSFKQGDMILYSDQLKGCCSITGMTRKTLERLDKRMREQQKRP